MFIEERVECDPHPSGVLCAGASISLRISENIAPRWGAAAHAAAFYKHCTPLGCGGRTCRASINIAPRWGAAAHRSVFYKHCTPLG